jgi:hypothetical protein
LKKLALKPDGREKCDKFPGARRRDISVVSFIKLRKLIRY